MFSPVIGFLRGWRHEAPLLVERDCGWESSRPWFIVGLGHSFSLASVGILFSVWNVAGRLVAEGFHWSPCVNPGPLRFAWLSSWACFCLTSQYGQGQGWPVSQVMFSPAQLQSSLLLCRLQVAVHHCLYSLAPRLEWKLRAMLMLKVHCMGVLMGISGHLGGPWEHIIAAGSPLVRTQYCLFIQTEKVTLFIGLLIFKISEIINEAFWSFWVIGLRFLTTELACFLLYCLQLHWNYYLDLFPNKIIICYV